jgi:hypothetical protein
LIGKIQIIEAFYGSKFQGKVDSVTNPLAVVSFPG